MSLSYSDELKLRKQTLRRRASADAREYYKPRIERTKLGLFAHIDRIFNDYSSRGELPPIDLPLPIDDGMGE